MCNLASMVLISWIIFGYYDVTVEGDFGLVTKNFFEQIDLISGHNSDF